MLKANGGGIEWLILKDIYNTKIYLQIKMQNLNCESYFQFGIQNSML